MRVIRGSRSVACRAPTAASAFGIIERNLKTLNTLPPSPTRSWVKKIDPPSSTLIAAARAAQIGIDSTRPRPDRQTSRIRLPGGTRTAGREAERAGTGILRDADAGSGSNTLGGISISFLYRCLDYRAIQRGGLLYESADAERLPDARPAAL